MATKRTTSGNNVEEPQGKRGRLGEKSIEVIAGEEDYDTVLDDEVEEELRAFELLQKGLPFDQENAETDDETVEEEKRCSSEESENDSYVEQEVHYSRRVNGKATKLQPARIQNQARKKARVLNETTGKLSAIRMPPDLLGEDQLLGDDLVETTGVPEDGEEPCLELNRVKLFKDVRAIDPLLTPMYVNQNNPNVTHIRPRSKGVQSAQSRVQPSLHHVRHSESSFQDPARPKSRDRSQPQLRNSNSPIHNGSQLPHSKSLQPRTLPSPQKVSQLGARLSPSGPLATRETFQSPIFQNAPRPKSANSEATLHQVQRNTQPHAPSKETFVDPVLKDAIPLPSSGNQGHQFRDPILVTDESFRPSSTLKSPSQLVPGPINVGHPQQQHRANDSDKRKTLTTQHWPASVEIQRSHLKSPFLAPQPSINPPSISSKQPLNHQSAKHPMHLDFLKSRELSPTSTSGPVGIIVHIDEYRPQEYCTLEIILQKRFKNCSMSEDEILQIIEDERPGIWCPELYDYVPFYEKFTWLAACNELQRFFCWPCLLFSGPGVWIVSCTETSQSYLTKEINRHEQQKVHLESVKQLGEWTLKNKTSIVKELSANNFVDGTWNDTDREKIVKLGRPRPILDSRTSIRFKKDKTVALETFYNQVGWICGCRASKKFYCWPCLLFKGDDWSYSGPVESADSAIWQHQTNQSHLNSCLELGKWELDLEKKLEAKLHALEKTRYFLRCLLGVVCALKKRINNAEFSFPYYIESLELMSFYNKKLGRFMMDKFKVTNTITSYITAMQDSVEFFIKDGVLNEIKNSNYVCLIFDHASGDSTKAILSVVARYVDGNGKICERFVKFSKVGYNTPATVLMDEFFRVVGELQCRSTLTGFTYDGYLVRPRNILYFNARVRKLCPQARFFHYSEHNLKRVVKQTLSHMPVCRRVFQGITELAIFFEKTPDAKKALQDMGAKSANFQNENQWAPSEFDKTLLTFYGLILKLLQNICLGATKWAISVVVMAANFLRFFKEPTNVFFVTMIGQINDQIKEMTKALHDEVGIDDLRTIAESAVQKVQQLGQNFGTLMESACGRLEVEEREKARTDMARLEEQFSTAIQSVVILINNRINEMESDYFKISKAVPNSSSHCITLKRQNCFLLNTSLPLNITSINLARELQFFHDSPLFSELDLSDVARLLNDYKMIRELPELFKFLQLALSVPRKLFDASRTPAVRRITAYLQGKKEPNSADALFWMEKEFLTNLQKDQTFYEKVTDRLISITKGEDFPV